MSIPGLRHRGSGPAAPSTVVIVGPTATGKSGLAIALAERLTASRAASRTGGGRAAEIVNADSMLVYRGMDIGTAKPTLAERARIVHHLVDVLEVTQTATVADFQAQARSAIDDCHRRGVLPIVVGGSALYIRSIVDEFTFPGTDPELRARLEADLDREGPEALHARLTAVDPAAAAAILPGNGRRVVRALEVVELTGQPFAARLPERSYLLPGVVQLGLAIDRPTLDARIEQRVDAMWAAGLVNEVAALSEHGLREGLTASRALGYRQVLELLDGTIDEAEARRRTVVGTRKFARRQDSWFRQDPRITWLAYDRPDLVDAALAASGLVVPAPGAPTVED